MGARLQAVLITLGLAACAVSLGDKCNTLRDQLYDCVGSRLARLDCSLLSDVDIDAMQDLTEGWSCEALAGALPEDGDLRSLTCRLFSVGCVSTTSSAPTPRALRYPIVLVNGIDQSPLFRYSPRIQRAVEVATAQAPTLAVLPAYATRYDRVPALWAVIAELRQATGAAKVNLVCHSKGGIDCRYLVSPNGYALDVPGAYADAVASVTTVGTAHRGTHVVDVMLGAVPSEDAGELLDDFASLTSDWYSPSVLATDPTVRAALGELGTDAMASFNATITDAPDVFYQSFAGYSRPFGESTAAVDEEVAALCGTRPRNDYLPIGLHPLARVLTDPNDGLVTIASAQWGHFAGCLPADHMEQLGQHNLPDVNVQNGFDIATFYASLAVDLGERGF